MTMDIRKCSEEVCIKVFPSARDKIVLNPCRV